MYELYVSNMSDQNTDSSVELDLSSGEDELLETNMTIEERTGQDESIIEAEDINENQILNSPISNSDSEYYIYHPPRYALPPYHSPISSALNLMDQIKLICSYHTLISRGIANQANTQLDTCGYPEPIDVIEGKNNFTEESRANISGSDNSEKYVSRSGRITKRKNYSDGGPYNMENISTHEDINKNEPTKKKAALKTKGNKNVKERLGKSKTNATERKMNPPSSLNIDKDIFDICDILSSHRADKTTTSDIKCPVCAVYYPGKHIQRHAASCQGNVEVMDPIKHSYDCNYCGKIMQTLEDFEIHSTECIARSAFV